MFVFKIHFKPFQVIFEKTSTAKFLGAAQKEKGRVCNCMQAHGSLQVRSWNYMQAYGTTCKLMEPHAS